MRWLGSVTDTVDMNLRKLWELVEDRGAWCAIGCEVSESDTATAFMKSLLQCSWPVINVWFVALVKEMVGVTSKKRKTSL